MDRDATDLHHREIWYLKKYAKYILPSNNFRNGSWEQIEGNGCSLLLHFSQGELMIRNENVVLEKWDLNHKHKRMKGLARDDSMVFEHKESKKRIRIKFLSSLNKTAMEECSHFANVVSKYCPIDLLQSNLDGANCNLSNKEPLDSILPCAQKSSLAVQGPFSTRKNSPNLSKVPLGMNPNYLDIHEVLVNHELPLQKQKINELVKACLEDPQFEELVKIVQDNLKSNTSVL